MYFPRLFRLKDPGSRKRRTFSEKLGEGERWWRGVAMLGTQPTTGRGLYQCIQVDTRGVVKFSAVRPARYRAAQNASDYFIFRASTRRGFSASKASTRQVSDTEPIGELICQTLFALRRKPNKLKGIRSKFSYSIIPV